MRGGYRFYTFTKLKIVWSEGRFACRWGWSGWEEWENGQAMEQTHRRGVAVIGSGSQEALYFARGVNHSPALPLPAYQSSWSSSSGSSSGETGKTNKSIFSWRSVLAFWCASHFSFLSGSFSMSRLSLYSAATALSVHFGDNKSLTFAQLVDFLADVHQGHAKKLLSHIHSINLHS